MLPSGIVTFLFTDIAGSTPLWERDPAAMKESLARHNAILHAAIADHGGRVFKIVGDAFQAAFPLPLQAIMAALAAQRALAGESWGQTGPLAVRMGIHSAPGEITEADYAVSHDLNRVARIMAAGHGGQILVSRALAELVRRDLGEDVRLKDLGEHILKGLAQSERLYQLIAPGLPASFPALASQSAPRHNLPHALSPFLGRESELAEIAALLEDPGCRLLTLVGPGGIGKSRLAIHSAEQVLTAFPQGAWFVRLDPLNSAEFLPETIGAALGLSFSGQITPAEQLLESLRWKELLLVLDNFEHLLSTGTGLLLEILDKAPGVKLLVTSRERLNLKREWVFEVHGLAFPGNGEKRAVTAYPAATLFLHHARRASGAALPDQDLACVARVARLVEGMPLAVELAAAWTRALSCREIAAEIERGLGILQARQPDLPERHHSMRAVFDHSWRLLPEDERAVLRRLAVFRGGFERESARQVAGASLDTLAALVDKSLLHHHPDGRYRIHELLRQFAADELERAGETAATRERHLAYFLQLAEQAEPQLWRDQEKAWLERLESEHENLRAALAWSQSPGSVLGTRGGLRLIVGIEQFWYGRGHTIEAADWLADLLAHPHSRDDLRVFSSGLRFAAGLDEWMPHDIGTAQARFERSLAIAEGEGDPFTLARVLSDFGNFYMNRNELAFAQDYLERSIVLYRELDYQPGIAMALRRLGHVFRRKNDYLIARSYYQKSLQVWRALGSSTGIAVTLLELGRSFYNTGEFTEARAVFDESLGLLQEVHSQWFLALVLRERGWLEFNTGEMGRGIGYLEESLALSRDLGMKLETAGVLVAFGEIARYQKDYARGLSLYHKAQAVFQELGDKIGQHWALMGEAFIAVRQGDTARAWQLFTDSLRFSRELDDGEAYDRALFLALSLIGFAGLSALDGKPEQAARLLGASEAVFASYPITPLTGFRADNAEYEHVLALVREQLSEATFNRLAQEGRALAAEGLDRVIEYALEGSTTTRPPDYKTT